MSDYILHIMSYAGIVPGATHYRGRVEGEHPKSCHGASHFNAPESRGKHTCEQGHELPEQVRWVVEASWSWGRYNRWSKKGFEGPGPEQFRTEQAVIEAAAARFLGEYPKHWWENKAVTPGGPGDKLWAGWVPRIPQDSDLVQENWGTLIAEVPAEHPTPEPFRLQTDWDQTPEMQAARKIYDAIARALPQCEHNQAWEKERLAARAVYLKTMRARDKLWKQQVKDDLAKVEAEARAAEEVQGDRVPDA